NTHIPNTHKFTSVIKKVRLDLTNVSQERLSATSLVDGHIVYLKSLESCNSQIVPHMPPLTPVVVKSDRDLE
ncbi:MAG: hypothetical protein WCF06_05200, partial [Nitrososphaeraceae archaeon]